MTERVLITGKSLCKDHPLIDAVGSLTDGYGSFEVLGAVLTIAAQVILQQCETTEEIERWAELAKQAIAENCRANWQNSRDMLAAQQGDRS
jgi:hypothetical protein